jgi:hypothetical protein
MKITVTKTKEYDIPDGPTCTYLVNVGGIDHIKECPALKKSVWFGSDGYDEDVFHCQAFDRQMLFSEHVKEYHFPKKLEECLCYQKSS